MTALPTEAGSGRRIRIPYSRKLKQPWKKSKATLSVLRQVEEQMPMCMHSDRYFILIPLRIWHRRTGGFHARFHAVSKRYDYLITTDVNNPFYYHYMGKDRKVLDVKRMSECARVFLGTHDFTSFTSSKLDPRKSKVKTITRLDIVQEEHAVRLVFEGNGFLRYMVRMIAQTLIEAGKHRLDVADVKQMLYGQDKHLCRYKAQAEGLYLVHVTYADTKKTKE